MEHLDCSIRRGSGGLGPGRATVPSLEEVALVLPTAGLAQSRGPPHAPMHPGLWRRPAAWPTSPGNPGRQRPHTS